MSLKWKYFLSKRRLTPSSFMTARGISSYDRLVDVLTRLDVEVPPFDEVGHLFLKPEQAPKIVPDQVDHAPAHNTDQVDVPPQDPVVPEVEFQGPPPDPMPESLPEILDSVAHDTAPADKTTFRRKKSSKASSEELPSTGSISENEGT